MVDVVSKEKRSEMMRAVRSRGNKSTELRMARLFRENGIRGWRRHVALLGKPDFVFRAERVAVFVDGCFWHGCPRHLRPPSSNQAFWYAKFSRNRARDRAVTKQLKEKGWRVIRVWEHAFANPKQIIQRINQILGSAKCEVGRGKLETSARSAD